MSQLPGQISCYKKTIGYLSWGQEHSTQRVMPTWKGTVQPLPHNHYPTAQVGGSSEHSVLLSQRYLHTCHPRGGVGLLLLKGMVMSLTFHNFAEKLFSHDCFLEGLSTWMGQCFYFLLIASPSSKHGYCRERFSKNTSMQVGVLGVLAYSASGSETAFIGTCGH